MGMVGKDLYHGREVCLSFEGLMTLCSSPAIA